MTTYAAVTGRITIPGTELGIRAEVTALPMSTGNALTFTDRLTFGPRTVVTDSAGNLPTSTSALKIPQGSSLGDGLLWKITVTPLDKSSGLRQWVVTTAAITADTTIQALAHPDLTMVTPELATTVGENAANAATSATAAAGSATAAAGSATSAATAKTAAETARDAAAGSASAAATSASGASTSATTATTKAGEAATSASSASTSASTATTKASEASTSASNAATSATAAQTAQTAAETARAGAEAVGSTNDTIISGRINDTTSATRAALNSSIDGRTPGAGASYFVRRSVQTTPQVGALVGKLRAGVSAGYLVGLGDSTMASSVGWFNQLATWLGSKFPAYSVIRRDWSDANQRYEPVPVVVQTGTAGDRGMVATGASTDWFFTVADSASTSPSTELRVEFDLKIPASGVALTLGGKYDTATNNRSWFVSLGTDNKISLFFSTDGTSGTQFTRTSTAALPAGAFGVRTQIKVTWQGNDGAGNNVTTFWYSLDRGATWTQVGSTVTTATAAATIFDSTTATQLNARGGTSNTTGGAVVWYGLKVWTSITSGARPVIDFATAQWNGYTGGVGNPTFIGFSGQGVLANSTGNTGAMTGAPVLFVLNGAVSGQTISYANDATRFPKLVPLAPDLAVINFSHNEVGLVAYRAPYKQLADAIIAVGPDAGIVATVQNQRKSPATNIVEHAIRGDQIRALAASQKYALIDIAAAFAATGNPDALVKADGIHPTDPAGTPDGTSGYEKAAVEAESIFEQWLRPAS